MLGAVDSRTTTTKETHADSALLEPPGLREQPVSMPCGEGSVTGQRAARSRERKGQMSEMWLGSNVAFTLKAVGSHWNRRSYNQIRPAQNWEH